MEGNRERTRRNSIIGSWGEKLSNTILTKKDSKEKGDKEEKV